MTICSFYLASVKIIHNQNNKRTKVSLSLQSKQLIKSFKPDCTGGYFIGILRGEKANQKPQWTWRSKAMPGAEFCQSQNAVSSALLRHRGSPKISFQTGPILGIIKTGLLEL